VSDHQDPIQRIAIVLDPVNSYEQAVVARLLDFFDSRTPWHRKLWCVSLSLTLREILEACRAARAGVLSDDALGYLAAAAQKLVGLDPGVPDPAQRRTVQAALHRSLRPDSLDYHLVSSYQADLHAGYLRRWAAALHKERPPEVEHTARAIASHLLDIGFSSNYLHRWWDYRLSHETARRTLAELLEQADELSQAKEQRFEVLAPVREARRRPQGPSVDWRTAQQVSDWLRENRSSSTGVRQTGGVVMSITALDKDAAVERAVERVDSLTSRTAIGTRHEVQFVDRVWVKGDASPHQLASATRGVWVRALEREGVLFSVDGGEKVDAAVELLSHLQRSSPPAAVAGGWAAIEALLSEPGDRGGAADRLAMLVACSFPRAELTALSYSLSDVNDDWRQEMLGVNVNRARAERVASRLISGGYSLDAVGASDRAAVARMKAVLTSPDTVLARVQEHAAGALRRLYRQRNLVLHAGEIKGVALRASLRTSAPLVGAGMDRIVHAAYVDHASPLVLAARARLALASLGSRPEVSCVNLLD
jgi:hypothetical protein